MRVMRERSRRQTAAETFSWVYPSPTSADSCARACEHMFSVCSECMCVHVYPGLFVYHATGGGLAQA